MDDCVVDAGQSSSSRHRVGQPAKFATRRTSSRSATWRSRSRLAAKKRPNNRPLRSLSSRARQLSALLPSRSRIPASSAEIAAFPLYAAMASSASSSRIATLLNRASKNAPRTLSCRLASPGAPGFFQAFHEPTDALQSLASRRHPLRVLEPPYPSITGKIPLPEILLVIPIEAGCNRLDWEERAMNCLSFSLLSFGVAGPVDGQAYPVRNNGCLACRRCSRTIAPVPWRGNVSQMVKPTRPRLDDATLTRRRRNESTHSIR
jgi:hypothetical protein